MSLASNAQTKLDSIMFNALNDYRIKAKLQPLKWDTCIYSDAEDTYVADYRDSLDITNDSDDINKSNPFIAGICGDYYVLIISLDADEDTNVDIIIAGTFIEEVEKDKDALELLLNSKSITGACFAGSQTLYMQNPCKQSIIKQFPLLMVTLIVGVSYPE